MGNNLNGIFAPTDIKSPKWVNKKGEDEFQKMLDRLVSIGKKITTPLKKNAKETITTTEDISQKTDEELLKDIPAGSYTSRPDGDITEITDGTRVVSVEWQKGKPIIKKAQEEFDPATQTREETVPMAQQYDATPRPLGEVFHTRGLMSERAIAKARNIVAQQVEKLKLPASDIYLLKTDISRYAGDGTPSTGRISFQVPFMTPQGDQRTLYADVDIVLSGLMPPSYFTDGLNTKFAFDENGVNEFLRGRDFEIMSNPKVTPETVFFEAPGHLASRSGIAITKYGQEIKDKEMGKEIDIETGTEIPTLVTGTEIPTLITELKALEKDINGKEVELTKQTEKLNARIAALEEKVKEKEIRQKLSNYAEQQQNLLISIRSAFEKQKANVIRYQKDLWRIKSDVKISDRPSYQIIVGELIKQFSKDIPGLKSAADRIAGGARTMTEVVGLIEEPHEGKPMPPRIIEEKPPVKPTGEPYIAPKGIVENSMQKSANVLDDLETMFSISENLDFILADVKKTLGVK